MDVSASCDIISAESAGSIPGLFAERVARSPEGVAYIQFDPTTATWREHSWSDIARFACTLRRALIRTPLQPGDRVCQFLPNCVEWVAFDIAALSLGLVPVSIYPNDSPENAAHILTDSGARLLVTDTIERWRAVSPLIEPSGQIEEVWLSRADGTAGSGHCRVQALPRTQGGPVEEFARPSANADDLATLIYTSGTTGRPKGVMLSHAAILWNAEATSRFIPPRQTDVFLSILPLAHAFERTLGYYLPMMAGATVAFSRSPDLFRQDLAIIRPSVLLAVPRLYERVYASILQDVQQSRVRSALLHASSEIGWASWRAKHQDGPSPGPARRLIWFMVGRLIAGRVLQAFGGRLRVAVCGGASLPSEVSRFLVGMGLPLVEGYGLTEAGPVVTACTVQDSIPGMAGWPLEGARLRIAENGELQLRSPGVMKGYWRDTTGTHGAFTSDGWLHTGDLARISNGRLCIEGRLTDTVILSTGQKLDLRVLETAIAGDPLVDQVCVVGTGRPCPIALVVLDRSRWELFASRQGLDPSRPDKDDAKAAILSQIAARPEGSAGYAQVRGVHAVLEPWTVRNGLLTPTLRVKRHAVEARYENEIRLLYDGIERNRLRRANGA